MAVERYCCALLMYFAASVAQVEVGGQGHDGAPLGNRVLRPRWVKLRKREPQQKVDLRTVRLQHDGFL